MFEEASKLRRVIVKIIGEPKFSGQLTNIWKNDKGEFGFVHNPTTGVFFTIYFVGARDQAVSFYFDKADDVIKYAKKFAKL